MFVPSASFHSSGGLPSGDAPVASGPRHCGQFSAASFLGSPANAADVISQENVAKPSIPGANIMRCKNMPNQLSVDAHVTCTDAVVTRTAFGHPMSARRPGATFWNHSGHSVVFPLGCNPRLALKTARRMQFSNISKFCCTQGKKGA
jgi:hypothetical protein